MSGHRGELQFVLSFPPHLVRDYVQRFGLGPGSRVLDPFCGTGTTLVEAKKLGVESCGIEPVGVSRLAASTKVNWTPDPDSLLHYAELVAEKALALLAADGVSDEPTPGVRLRSLPPPTAKLLFKNSISALPLHKVLVLREALAGEHDAAFADHEALALARILLTEVGNLRFGPEVVDTHDHPIGQSAHPHQRTHSQQQRRRQTEHVADHNPAQVAADRTPRTPSRNPSPASPASTVATRSAAHARLSAAVRPVPPATSAASHISTVHVARPPCRDREPSLEAVR